MGGHGALTLYLASETKQYRSASAFAPISNPINAPWGHKAFGGYLQGGVEEAQEIYDATELIKKHKGPVHILVDYVSTVFRMCSLILYTLPWWERGLDLRRTPVILTHFAAVAFAGYGR